MKRYLSVLIAVVMIFVLVGCNNSNQDEEKNLNTNLNEKTNIELEDTTSEEKEKNNDEVEVEKHFDSDVNTYALYQFVRLEENPTTGYTWTYSFDDNTIACVEDDEYTQNVMGEDFVGVGGVHTYRLAGLAKGETTVKFDYMRSWEGPESSISTIVFGISIDENNQITITSETKLK